MSNQNKKKKSKLLAEIFDSMFIMILCFATLLTSMLMQGETGELSYFINYKTLIIMVIGLVIYLAFMLRQSDKELKDMINHIYRFKENDEVNKK